MIARAIAMWVITFCVFLVVWAGLVYLARVFTDDIPYVPLAIVAFIVAIIVGIGYLFQEG